MEFFFGNTLQFPSKFGWETFSSFARRFLGELQVLLLKFSSGIFYGFIQNFVEKRPSGSLEIFLGNTVQFRWKFPVGIYCSSTGNFLQGYFAFSEGITKF